MEYFHLQPETGGHDSVKQLANGKFEVVFDWWPAEGLLQSGSSIFCTEEISDAIKSTGLTGVEFTPVRIKKGDQFFTTGDAHKGEKMKNFVLMQFSSNVAVDDFACRNEREYMPMIVSEKALALLEQFGCDIESQKYVEGVVPISPIMEAFRKSREAKGIIDP